MEKDFYYDKVGNEIHEGDLLEVSHFIGGRRRKHFMYHIAIRQNMINGQIWWAGKDYQVCENKGHYWLRAVGDENGKISGCRVIARAKWDENFKKGR